MQTSTPQLNPLCHPERSRGIFPVLRFSEFTDEWQEKKLGDIAVINPPNGRLPDHFYYIDLESVSDGKLNKLNLVNSSNAPSRAQRVLKKEDILYQTVRPYQKNNLFFNNDGDFIASTGYAQIRFKGAPRFFYQLLYSDSFVNKVLVRCTGTSYPAINSSDLASIKIKTSSLPEQSKIANFLTTVDEKIEKLEEKKKGFEKYKKSVMQAIFSQKIRFKPDLSSEASAKLDKSGYPDWEEMKLGEITVSFDSKRKPISSEQRVKGKYPYYGANGIVDYVENYIFDGIYVLVAEDGVVDVTKYPVHFVSGKFWANNHTHILKGKNVSDRFLYYSLQNIRFARYITGSAQTKLNNQVLNKIVLNIPIMVEQEKIAEFLTSLDNKVDLINKELKQAKLFKKSLLQRMFV